MVETESICRPTTLERPSPKSAGFNLFCWTSHEPETYAPAVSAAQGLSGAAPRSASLALLLPQIFQLKSEATACHSSRLLLGLLELLLELTSWSCRELQTTPLRSQLHVATFGPQSTSNTLVCQGASNFANSDCISASRPDCSSCTILLLLLQGSAPVTFGLRHKRNPNPVTSASQKLPVHLEGSGLAAFSGKLLPHAIDLHLSVCLSTWRPKQ